MTIALESLGTLTLELGALTVMEATPAGTRLIGELSDARWEGERVRAARKGPAAADWITIGPDGTASLDLRLLVETADGATVFVRGVGRADASKGPGTGPSFLALRFETGDPRYRWLNRVVAAGRGVLRGTTVAFDLAEIR